MSRVPRLSKKDTIYLENDPGIDLWDPVLDPDYRREAEGSPVRAIVKTLVTTSSIDPDPRTDEKLLKKMLKGIRWINKQGVLVWMENYAGMTPCSSISEWLGRSRIVDGMLSHHM